MIGNLLVDIRCGARAMRARPVFAVVVTLTLALGIGVNVAILSLADQILLRPLPVPEPDRLVNLTDPLQMPPGRMSPRLLPQMMFSDGGGREALFSYPMFRDLERQQQPFVGLAAHTFFDARLSSGERTRLATGVFASGSYFSVLGLRPAIGRLLGPQDAGVDGQAESVVLSYTYWQNEFNGIPNVLGRKLIVNDVPLTIVGVAPRGFHGTAVGVPPSVFVPITIKFPTRPGALAGTTIPNHDRRDSYWLHLFARLKPGVSREQAAAAMTSLYRGILSEVEAPLLMDVSEQQREAFRARPLVLEPGGQGRSRSEILSPARNSLGVLLAVSGAVLLLCCANVGGLVLLRATARSGEIAVRASMGATRARLSLLLLTESLVLALPAALLSLPVALLVLQGTMRVPGMPAAAADVSLSIPAALVAIGVALASTAAMGVLPVRGLIRSELGKTLQASATRLTSSKGVARFRVALATAQVALSMALLATTFVFAQSLANIARLDLGIDIDSVAMFSVPQLGLPSDVQFTVRIADALKAIPGVSSVTSSMFPLLSLNENITTVTIKDSGADVLQAHSNVVSPGFFETFGVHFLAGRDFNDQDLTRPAAIVTQRFAEHFGLAPELILGRAIDPGTGSGPEIIGVVSDVRSGKITGEIQPQLFLPTRFSSTFYVSGALPATALVDAVRGAINRVDPNMPTERVQMMKQQFQENIATERALTGASAGFAVLATTLAALGLFGVLAHSVAQRSREIGLRYALGAPPARIRGMVMRQVMSIAGVGVVIGGTAAVLLGPGVETVLFGVKAENPLALAAAAVTLVAVTLGAAYVPIRRASRVDPMTVLRYE